MRTVKAIVFNKHGIGHMVRVERFPKPGETISAREWHFGEDGGKGTNVAVALGRLGVPCALVCRVGDDDGGRLGQRWLEEAGVDTGHFLLCREVATSMGLVIIQGDGENMIIGSDCRECCMTEQDVRDALADYPDAEYFLAGLEIDQQLPIDACRYAKSRSLTTLLNASPLCGALPDPLEFVDYLLVNELEGKTLIREKENSRNWTGIAERIRERYCVKTVVMTLGSRGCVVCSAEETTWIPAYNAPCVDTLGAGDGFMAAFAAGLSWGMTDVQAADWASRYSAVVVGREGAVLTYPTLEEVKEISRSFQARGVSEGA